MTGTVLLKQHKQRRAKKRKSGGGGQASQPQGTKRHRTRRRHSHREAGSDEEWMKFAQNIKTAAAEKKGAERGGPEEQPERAHQSAEQHEQRCAHEPEEDDSSVDYDVTDVVMSERDADLVTGGVKYVPSDPSWSALSRAIMGLVRAGHRCTYKGRRHQIHESDLRDGQAVPISLLADTLDTTQTSVWAIALQSMSRGEGHGQPQQRRFTVLLQNKNKPAAVLPWFEHRRSIRRQQAGR
jgi:hypothetical protein